MAWLNRTHVAKMMEQHEALNSGRPFWASVLMGFWRHPARPPSGTHLVYGAKKPLCAGWEPHPLSVYRELGTPVDSEIECPFCTVIYRTMYRKVNRSDQIVRKHSTPAARAARGRRWVAGAGKDSLPVKHSTRRGLRIPVVKDERLCRDADPGELWTVVSREPTGLFYNGAKRVEKVAVTLRHSSGKVATLDERSMVGTFYRLLPDGTLTRD